MLQAKLDRVAETNAVEETVVSRQFGHATTREMGEKTED